MLPAEFLSGSLHKMSPAVGLWVLQRCLATYIPVLASCMLQAHLAAKAALLGGLAWQHEAQTVIADDQCGSAVACLQVSQLHSFEQIMHRGSVWALAFDRTFMDTAASSQNRHAVLTDAAIHLIGWVRLPGLAPLLSLTCYC
jgi:hypothetical protein